jgi:hypothetical protein
MGDIAMSRDGKSLSAITLSGASPIDLVPQRPATAVAEGDSVVMTLPVSAPGSPETVVSFRVLLTPGQAQSVALELTEAAISAYPYRY